MNDGYIYYRLFNDKGSLTAKDPPNRNDESVGRITSNLITSPLSARNVKNSIANYEGFPGSACTSVFFSSKDESAVVDNRILSVTGSGSGTEPEDPIWLVLQGDQDPRGTAKSSSSTIDLTGQWSVEEHIPQTTISRGTYTLTMTSATTFKGFGNETDTFLAGGGQASYSFKIVNGNIVDRYHIEWTCVGTKGISGSWGARASLSADGKQMTGSLKRISGNCVDVPEAVYKRL